MQLFGLILVVVGCTVLGWLYSKDLEQRHIQIRELRRIIAMLEGEIRCANSTLAESFHHVAGRSGAPFSRLFAQMADHMEASCGDTLKEIFSRHVEEDLKESALQKEDKEMLKHLGEQLGYLDVKMQLSALKMYGDQLEETYEQAALKFQKQAKMYRYLGVLGGLFLAILFI